MIAEALVKPRAASEWEASRACAGCIPLSLILIAYFSDMFSVCLLVLPAIYHSKAKSQKKKCVVVFLWNLFSQTVMSLQSYKWLLHATLAGYHHTEHHPHSSVVISLTKKKEHLVSLLSEKQIASSLLWPQNSFVYYVFIYKSGKQPCLIYLQAWFSYCLD